MDSSDLLLRFEQWQNGVRREVERQGRYAQALNSVLIVGAFIAGVQGQLLSEIIDLDSKAFRARSCNLISFLGLVVEVAGTFFGAANAVKLQLRAQRGTRALDCMEECKASLKIIVKYIAKNQAQLHASPSKAEAHASSTKDVAEPSPVPTPTSHAPSPHRHQYRQKIAPDDTASNTSTLPDRDPVSKESEKANWIAADTVNIHGGSFFMVMGDNHAYWDTKPASAEVQLEICEKIIEAMERLTVLLGHEAPEPLLFAIDAIIGEVHSIVGDSEDNGARRTDENGHEEKLASGNELKYVQLPAHHKHWSPLEKVSLEIVSLVAMGFGVLCLAVSIILFAAARSDVLGNSVWVTCLSALLTVTLISVLPFVPVHFVGASVHSGRAGLEKVRGTVGQRLSSPKSWRRVRETKGADPC
ncbi:hypothetical protein BKA70DRAFT_1277687 [Coprinopsis sp. MPI-PUGE-AT-0042]|nr:hypothetical protein BKA70DRAFT_1277687 [Coprinopsis sp. MPI-PUGE-AT-0042]